MNENELLLAMSKLIDAKLKPIQDKLEEIEIEQTETKIKVDNIQLEIKKQDRANRKDFKRLYDGMDTLVEVLEQKGILPKAE